MLQFSGFQPNQEVTSPDFLFGHNEPGALLDRMVERLYQGTNFQLLGERRAGKTSLLRCCAARLCGNSQKLIPVYVNYHEHDTIKGNEAAYRLLLAYIHASCIQYIDTQADPVFKQFNVGDILLSRSSTPLEHYAILSSVSDYQVRTTIKNYLHALYEQGFGVVLLFDEYEYLMVRTFDNQTGAFFFIRDLTSDFPLHPGKPRPLTYVVAGATPWHKLPLDVVGSPVLNKITAQFFVSPMNLKSFTKMWDHCLSASSIAVRRFIVESKIDAEIAYLLAGGWPFIGKLIGEHLSFSLYNEDEIFDVASLNFQRMWSQLEDPERQLILDVTGDSRVQNKHDSLIREMINRGLLYQGADGEISPCGQLWTRYIKERISMPSLSQISVDTTVPSIPDRGEELDQKQNWEKESIKKRSTWADLLLALVALAVLSLLLVLLTHFVPPLTLPVVIVSVIIIFVLILMWLLYRQKDLTEAGFIKIIISVLSKLTLIRGNGDKDTDTRGKQ